LSLEPSEVEELIKGYEDEVRALKDDSLRLAWYMRGALSYDEAMMLGLSDKEILAKIVKDNIKTTEETKLPFF
jgi:hypothetical protein